MESVDARSAGSRKPRSTVAGERPLRDRPHRGGFHGQSRWGQLQALDRGFRAARPRAARNVELRSFVFWLASRRNQIGPRGRAERALVVRDGTILAVSARREGLEIPRQSPAALHAAPR